MSNYLFCTAVLLLIVQAATGLTVIIRRGSMWDAPYYGFPIWGCVPIIALSQLAIITAP